MELLKKQFESKNTDGLLAQRIYELSILFEKCYFIARELKSASTLESIEQLVNISLERSLRRYLEPSCGVQEIWAILSHVGSNKSKSTELEKVTKALLEIIAPGQKIEKEEDIRSCYLAWSRDNHPDKKGQADYDKYAPAWIGVNELWNKRTSLLDL
jgi:hypothetical protein